MPTVVDPGGSDVGDGRHGRFLAQRDQPGAPEHVDIARAEGACGVGLGDGHLGVTAQASFETHGSRRA